MSYTRRQERIRTVLCAAGPGAIIGGFIWITVRPTMAGLATLYAGILLCVVSALYDYLSPRSFIDVPRRDRRRREHPRTSRRRP